ncbi:MAG: radical SAM protein [Methanosarcinaceae archaeon]|jgi:putative pyruvate formate lyase activating enzyme|nr:radical SAM protein [Methanosarcinaceae archaeon]NKQ38750.1 radical SAM protein [Methanosarcinales archaeon]
MNHIDGLTQYFNILNIKSKAKYLIAKDTSLFSLKMKQAHEILKNCHFCEHRCGVNRINGEMGLCGVGKQSYYASEFIHYGEESELVPSHTIFFIGCNFSCIYCQNFDIASGAIKGYLVDPIKIAEQISMQHKKGTKNVNFVGGDPIPHLYTIFQIMNACNINIPMIWNSNAYCSNETMELLNDVIDVYLLDFRYGNDACANKYSHIKNYWNIITRNLNQANKNAELIIRHLVLPGHVECCTKPILKYVAKHMQNVRFNLMFQYNPCYRAYQYPEMDRVLNYKEKTRALELVKKAGLTNLV